MDEVYKPGAVSSLIHLETKSKSAEKPRKEQKKLDKLFGRMTTKKDSETTTNVSSDEDVSKNFIDDESKSSKKKKKKEKIEICEEVESSFPKKKKKQKVENFEESIEVDPSFLKKKKKENVLEDSEKIDSSSSKKKKKQKEEFFEESIEVDSSSLKKKKILDESEEIDSSASKKKKKQKEICEKSNEVNSSSLKKKKEKDIFGDLKKKKKEKKEIFEESEDAESSPKKKKKKKNISSFEDGDDGENNNNKEEKNLLEKNTKTDKINHIKEKRRNNEDISISLEKPKKFKEITSDEKKSKKEKKRKIEEVSYSDEEGDDNDDTLSERKKLKKDTREEALPFSPEKPRQKANPQINDVLCAIKESDGSKSRTRTTKQQDLSDIEDEQPIQKRQKKKRDKKNDCRTVFVGNLPLTITKKQLKQMFTPCGQIENLRMRGAIPADPKQSKRYAILKKVYHPKCLSINAYVCFVDKESADKACKTMNGTIVEGQHIRVNSSIISKATYDYKRSVFVGNLPFVISDEDVRQHFLDCGEIVDIRLVRDWKTGIGKGFGYVKFENTDSAELAIRLDNSVLKTRKIRVSPSETDPKNKRTDKGPVKKEKTKKKDKKDFVGVKAEKKKKKLKPKHLARKMGLAKKKTDMTPQKVVEKNTDGPNKHMVFQ